MYKDKTILIEWYKIAYKKAKMAGLKRLINHDVLIDYLMQDRISFTTLDEDKELAINFIYETLMELELICRFIQKTRISEHSVRHAHEFIRW